MQRQHVVRADKGMVFGPTEDALICAIPWMDAETFLGEIRQKRANSVWFTSPEVAGIGKLRARKFKSCLPRAWKGEFLFNGSSIQDGKF